MGVSTRVTLKPQFWGESWIFGYCRMYEELVLWAISLGQLLKKTDSINNCVTNGELAKIFTQQILVNLFAELKKLTRKLNK